MQTLISYFPSLCRFPDTCIPKHFYFDKQRLHCEVLSNRPLKKKKTAFPQLIHHCVSSLAFITHRVRIHTCLIMPQISHHHRAMLRMLIKRCLQNVASKLPFENGYPPGLQTFDSYCQGAFEKVPKSFAIMSRLQPSDAVKIINSNKKILGTY